MSSFLRRTGAPSDLEELEYVLAHGKAEINATPQRYRYLPEISTRTAANCTFGQGKVLTNLIAF